MTAQVLEQTNVSHYRPEGRRKRESFVTSGAREGASAKQSISAAPKAPCTVQSDCRSANGRGSSWLADRRGDRLAGCGLIVSKMASSLDFAKTIELTRFSPPPIPHDVT